VKRLWLFSRSVASRSRRSSRLKPKRPAERGAVIGCHSKHCHRTECRQSYKRLLLSSVQTPKFTVTIPESLDIGSPPINVGLKDLQCTPASKSRQLVVARLIIHTVSAVFSCLFFPRSSWEFHQRAGPSGSPNDSTGLPWPAPRITKPPPRGLAHPSH